MQYQKMIETVVKIARSYKQYGKMDDYKSAVEHLYILIEKQYKHYNLEYNTDMIRTDVNWLLS